MPNGDYHVTYRPDGKWELKKEGAERALSITDTKKECIDNGRVVTNNQGKELFIHNIDGKIGQRDSHGKDPYPPKG